MDKPGIYGIRYSNRDFAQVETWGKNQFNSSFPTGLVNYLYYKNLENNYITLDKELKVRHTKISTLELFGISPNSSDLFFSFESVYSPYQQYVIGSLPRVDLVTQLRNNGNCLRPIEIKLTALPDNSTCNLNESDYGTEIVVRPDTIVYLACSIISNYKNHREDLLSIFDDKFIEIDDWSDGNVVWELIPEIVRIIDSILIKIIDKQEPLLMQPIWKTIGKSPHLANNCLDVFVWSNFAFTRLFMDVAKLEMSVRIPKITRHLRTIIWLFKMLFDFARNGQFDHNRIIDELSFNTKNDKAFAVNGRITHKYMNSRELMSPRITKMDIKSIIIGGGQNLLSPERRFDAIIYNSPELFSI